MFNLPQYWKKNVSVKWHFTKNNSITSCTMQNLSKKSCDFCFVQVFRNRNLKSTNLFGQLYYFKNKQKRTVYICCCFQLISYPNIQDFQGTLNELVNQEKIQFINLVTYLLVLNSWMGRQQKILSCRYQMLIYKIQMVTTLRKVHIFSPQNSLKNFTQLIKKLQMLDYSQQFPYFFMKNTSDMLIYQHVVEASYKYQMQP
eukprot:TRINITY_DN4223_c0_g1_i1.p5 TRINITY_DN4223_c0_g1~~TRINITY_DN4223_c0_g1_i1.p5  ORF type:complete len:200 (-),score=-9.71 TRINITY_DN4223_c0_g1_i1:599-1198(-)